MQATGLRALEFDRIRDALSHETLTPLGRARALSLEPATEPDAVRAGLALTAQAVSYTAGGGSLAISAADDLLATLAVLDIDEQHLEPNGLLDLARFVESVDRVARGVLRLAAQYEKLATIAAQAASFEAEAAAIRRAIEPSGDVSDAASPALRDIRDRLRKQRARLRASLESLTRGRDAAKYLQDQIITDRNGRYVVVVRAEHREAIPGIVHGSSASGASLYLEPLGTVELNNEIVGLVEREKEEIRRILLALTNAFRERADELVATLDVAAQLDELHAKASLARRMDGVAPEMAADGRIEFRGARHPLLIPSVRDLTDTDDETDEAEARRPKAPVASDLIVVPPARALVISGPNTGGKTVALKAIGLLALMAQAGLLVPVEAGSCFTPFRTVFADIGDEQSIAASLSTFSAHIANIVAMDRGLELPALVLLDEVGGGTDPMEGGALGTAIIEHFRRRGALVVATTHDDTLKSYAATTAGVLTAGFGFNPETYAPTYRLLYGAPGRSLALEIAERLGMPFSVIVDARARRSGRETQLSAHLARLDHEMAAVERQRQEAEDAQRAVAQARHELIEREARLTEREAVLRKRLDDKLNEKLRDARAEVDRVVTQLRHKADTLADQAGKRASARGPVLTTGDIGGLRREAKSAIEGIAEAAGVGQAEESARRLDGPPTIGQTVLVASFGADGIVRGVSGKHVDVDIRGKRMRVSPDDLRQAGRGETRPPAARTSRAVHTMGVAERAVQSELMLIGSTVDDAIGRAEKFLDDALLTDARRIRVVHGHGTGRLREALRAYFRDHPLVATVTAAAENEGGAAATIVELKD